MNIFHKLFLLSKNVLFLFYFRKFKCECFDGYEGPNCSDGPKSFCHSAGEPACRSGGSCL